FVTTLTVLLFVVTSLDAAFTWCDRVVAISHMATVREFCAGSPAGRSDALDYCTLSA
ncbi:unnamed protein product, partial [Effrenium voratum]